MSNRTCSKRFRRAAIALAAVSALAAIPAGAQAQTQVKLRTAKPFVVLGGSSVTNSGQPSTLYGDLGVSPGAALTMGTSTINGAIHPNDTVAAQAQLDLAQAYDEARLNTPFTDKTGQDLGLQQPLTAGNYRYSSAALLTGTLVLDGENNPNAQFVFQIGTQLTTAVGSSVQLIRGASPCNVYWQVGSLAALNSATAFQGNIMAGASITLGDAASVKGRLLSRTSANVTLIHNVLDASMCGTGTSAPIGSTPSDGTAPDATGTTPGGTTPVSATPAPVGTPARILRPFQRPTRRGTAILRPPSGRNSCTQGFRARVRGRMIRQVAFSLDGKRISRRTRSPFQVSVKAAPGRHKVTARVSFTDATRAKTLTLRYRACAAAVLQPRRGPSRFTG
jgi:hypothetical protein